MSERDPPMRLLNGVRGVDRTDSVGRERGTRTWDAGFRLVLSGCGVVQGPAGGVFFKVN